jgi:cytochrome P450 hydroxylase
MATDLPEASAPSIPRAWPFLGHAPALLRDPLRFFGMLAQHGDIVRIRLGPVRSTPSLTQLSSTGSWSPTRICMSAGASSTSCRRSSAMDC